MPLTLACTVSFLSSGPGSVRGSRSRSSALTMSRGCLRQGTPMIISEVYGVPTIVWSLAACPKHSTPHTRVQAAMWPVHLTPDCRTC